MKKNTNLIIGISIVIVVWCAFMGYRHITGEQDTDTHRQREDERLTEIAKKSPRAGLAQMARALNDYHNKNHQYPSKLLDLYPTYLANKSFIEEIDWYYEPRGDNFHLTKTLAIGTKRMVASIDKGLRPQAEKGIMVATPTPIPKTQEVEKPDVNILERYEPTAQDRLDLARDKFLKLLSERELRVASVSELERDEERIVSTLQPELLSIQEPEIGSGLEYELSHSYLVWKDKNGVLGFSNIQYPDTDRLSMCAIGRWYDVKIPKQKQLEPIDSVSETAKSKKSPGMIATGFDRQCLVWKDKHGTLGFGNVEYPERDPVSILQTDGWVSIERPSIATETGTYKDHGRQEDKSDQAIASELSNQYLVWKDKDGTLGFGNVEYPEMSHTSYIHFNGSWEPVAH